MTDLGELLSWGAHPHARKIVAFIVVQSLSHVWLFGLRSLQHIRPPYPSPSPGVCPSSYSLNQWCHPTISPLATSFCLQSFTASGSFTNSQLFASAGQNIGASASASVLPIGIQGWFPLGLTGLISWQSKGLSRVFSSTTVQKHQFFSIKPSLWFQLTQPYTTTGKTIALTFVGKSMSLLFNMLSRFFIGFLPRSKHLLISWLQSLPTLILEPKKRKFVTACILSLSICYEW